MDSPRERRGLDVRRRGARRDRDPRQDRPARRLRRSLARGLRAGSRRRYLRQRREHRFARPGIPLDRDRIDVSVDHETIEARCVADRRPRSGSSIVPSTTDVVHDRCDFVADTELDPPRELAAGSAMRSAPWSQPGSRSPDVAGGRSERAPQCASTWSTSRRPLAVLRELVDPRPRRWVELAAADDASLLERLQPRSEDVGAAAGQPRMEIRVPKLVVFEQLADDQQRPALTDQVERMRHRAVLVVALGHVFDTSRSSFEMTSLNLRIESVCCSIPAHSSDSRNG